MPVTIASVLFPLPAVGKDLREVITSYEASAEKLGQSGLPIERAQAIRALASVASPRYPSARDRLVMDSSREVRIALLDAIYRMGDESPAAKSIVLSNLRSGDDEILSVALRASYQFRFDFASVWRKDAPLATWNHPGGGYELPLGHIDGIARARPWNDPAWKVLSERMRRALLARAGSREALVLLANSLAKPDEKGWNAWVPAEEVDPPALREMLAHPRSEIVALASESLLAADDSQHRAGVARCLTRPDSANVATECSPAVMSNLALRVALPSLDRESLIALARRDPSKWFPEVQSELRGRGEPLSDTQLAAESAPIHLRLREMLNGRSYEELDPLLITSLARDFPGSAARDFIAAMPAEIAHRNFLFIRDWVMGAGGDGNDGGCGAGSCEAFKMLGMLARGDDEEELWRNFLAAPEPLEDLDRLTPVLWGVTERSNGLRRLLANALREGWFPGGEKYRSILRSGFFQEALGAVEATLPPEACSGGIRSSSWNPFDLPSESESFGAMREALAAGFKEAYPGRDRRSLGRDFLVLRGFAEESRDPNKALELLWNPCEPIRVAARDLFESPPPLHVFGPSDRNSSISRGLMAALRTSLKGFSFAPTVLPSVPLTPTQQDALGAILDRKRASFFDSLIEGVRHPPPELIACGALPPTPALVPLPSDELLRARTSYTDELRALLGSPEVDLRHAAGPKGICPVRSSG